MQGNLQNGIRWVLEEHPSRFPAYQDCATLVTESIYEYGASLYKQLRLDEFLENEASTLVVLEVFDTSADSLFHAVHWEALAVFCARRDRELSVIRVIETASISFLRENPLAYPSLNKTEPPSTYLAPLSESASMNPVNDCTTRGPQRKIDILLITARPQKDQEDDPFVAAQALHNAVKTTKKPESWIGVHLEMCRPATWLALTELIHRRTAKWRQRGGTGAWYDIVHFDCHGITRNNVAYLLFHSRGGQNVVRKSASHVGELLSSNSIRCAVLYACNSAEVNGSISSNMVRTLLQFSLQVIVAMSFSFTATVAGMLVESFYNALLTDPMMDTQTAIDVSRMTLYKNSKRLAWSDIWLDLPDFIVPVLYTRGHTILIDHEVHQAWKEHDCSRIEQLPSPQEDPLLSQPAKRSTIISPRGRSQNILDLEWYVFGSSNLHVTALTGAVGVGKTKLAQFVAQWWLLTGSINGCTIYPDLGPDNQLDLFSRLERYAAQDGEHMAESPDLLILDHMDSMFHPSGVHWTASSADILIKLEKCLKSIDGNFLRCLVLSRSDRNYLHIAKRHFYRLEGLSNFHALKLAQYTIEENMRRRVGSMDLQEPFMQPLLRRFNNNALCIKLFLRTIGRTSRQNVTVCGRNLWNFHWWHYPTSLGGQEALFNTLLRGFEVLDDDDPHVQKCESLVKRLCDLGKEDDSALGLAGLAVPVRNCRQEWHTKMIEGLSECCPLVFNIWPSFNKESFHQLVNTYLLDSGWLGQFEIFLPDGSKAKYYKIHPLLTNALRKHILASSDHPFFMFTNFLFSLFDAHTKEILASLWSTNDAMAHMSIFCQIQIENLNLLASIDSSLDFCTLVQPRDIEHQRMTYHGTMFNMCRTMVDIVHFVNSPAVYRIPWFRRIHSLARYVETRTKADQECIFAFKHSNIAVLLSLYTEVLNEQVQEDPRMTLQDSRKVLRFAVKACENGDLSEEMMPNLTCILLHYGYACIFSRCSLSSARTAFQLVLQCIPKPVQGKYDKDKEIEILISRITALIGLYQSSKDLLSFCGFGADDIGNLYNELSSEAFRLFSMREPCCHKFVRDIQNWVYDIVKDVPDVFQCLPPPDASIEKPAGMVGRILSTINNSMRLKDEACEIEHRRLLIHVDIHHENWVSAACHIDRIRKIEETVWRLPGYYETEALCYPPHDRGPPIRPNRTQSLTHQQLQAAKYGAIYLRLGDIDLAVKYFEHLRLLRLGLNDTRGPSNETWREWVDQAVDDIRVGILMLASPPLYNEPVHAFKPISLTEAHGLDDTMQKLIRPNVKERFDWESIPDHQLDVLIKCPFAWDEPRIASFIDTSLVYLMIHFYPLTHCDPEGYKRRLNQQADEQSGVVSTVVNDQTREKEDEKGKKQTQDQGARETDNESGKDCDQSSNDSVFTADEGAPPNFTPLIVYLFGNPSPSNPLLKQIERGPSDFTVQMLASEQEIYEKVILVHGSKAQQEAYLQNFAPGEAEEVA